MSDPTRYRVANNQAQLTLGGGILAVDTAGPLVMYDDYARLKAEVERLRKAGDDLAGMVGYHVPYEDQIELEKAWNAARRASRAYEFHPMLLVRDIAPAVSHLLFQLP